MNTWIPYEVQSSPHDLEGYDEPLFPVADTPIPGHDWLMRALFAYDLVGFQGKADLLHFTRYVEAVFKTARQARPIVFKPCEIGRSKPASRATMGSAWIGM